MNCQKLEIHSVKKLKFNSLNLKTHFLFPAILCICYFIFPTQNADIDSWYYASCIKYNKELINSHHLIFNVIALGFYHFLQFFSPNIEAISAINAMNALAASLSLLFSFKIFKQLDCNNINASIYTFFCGASFGFFRFATDAETYILPIFFSLLSTYYLIKNKNPFQLFLSALFSVLAVLTHQLHIWWTLALFLYLLFKKEYNSNSKILFSTALLIVPVFYYLAFNISGFKGNLFQFILGEYNKGNASIDVSWLSFKLSFINLFRSFIQVHGNIYYIFQAHPFICIGIALICLFGAASAIQSIFKTSYTKGLSKKMGFFPKFKTQFNSLFLMALIFHFCFAFLSSGNAEFMAMIPFLLTFFIASKYQLVKINFTILATLTLFIWNLSFGILSHSILDIKKVDKQVQFITQNPQSIFISENKNLIENQLTYQFGFMDRPNLYKSNIAPSEIKKLIQQDFKIYTDIKLQKGPISRKEMLTTNSFAEELIDFQLQKVDSFDNIYGKNFILKILPK